MDNPIFIIGLPRTGSTVWHNIIAMDSGILRLAEMLYLHPFRKDFRNFLKKHAGHLEDRDEAQHFVDMLFSCQTLEGLSGAFWRFENIKGVHDKAFRESVCFRIINSDKSVGEIFKIIVEEITRYNNFNRCCIKFPVYVNHVRDLIKWYPDCKIVHIVRDPRAICISKTNDPTGFIQKMKNYPFISFVTRKIMIIFVVFQYILSSKLHSKYKIFSNYSLFRYEDLLGDPERTIKMLCNFIDIEFRTDLLEPHKGVHEHQPSSITGKRQKDFDKDSASRWKKIITPFENFLITFLTRRSMKRFDYNPETHPVFK